MVSYTPIARAIQIVPLDPTYRNQWGSSSAVDAWPVVLEQLAAGITAVPLAGLTSKTLSVANNAPDQSRANQINFNGALTGNCTVTIPGIARTGYAMNNTTGSHNVILTTGAGSTLTLTPGLLYRYRCDGTNVVADAIAGNAQTATTATTATNLNGGSVNATTGTFSGAISAPAAAIAGDLACAILATNGQRLNQGPFAGWAMSAAGTSSFGPGLINYSIIANGSNVLATNFYAASDVRLKRDIAEITPEAALDWVMSARPVTYRKLPGYDAPEAAAVPEAGLLAQDQVRAGYGQYVGVAACPGMPERVDPDGFRSLPDVSLNLPAGYQIAFLTRALQAALTRIAALEAR